MADESNTQITGLRDPKGYYAILGVPTNAPADLIKKEYRRLAKIYHPDRNQSPSAKVKFQKINEAYDVLSKNDKRLKYDSLAQEHARAMATRRDHPASSSTAIASLVKCSVCGTVTAQPRFAVFWSVISFILVSRRNGVQGVFCRSCADKQALRSSLQTWLWGWWAFPRGPFLTLDALLRNLLGGDKPSFENVDILGRQARAFAVRGKPALAKMLVEQALMFVRDRRQMADLLSLQAHLGPGKPPSIEDRWRLTDGRAFYMQALPLGLLFIGLLYALTIPASMLWNNAFQRDWSTTASILPKTGEIWHVAVDQTAMRSGPSLLYTVVAPLPRFSTVQILNATPTDGYVLTRLNNQIVGYSELNSLRPGEGLTAWKQWCREGSTNPGQEPLILQRSSFGLNTLRFNNQTDRPLVVKLRNLQGQTLLSFYFQGKAQVALPALSSGEYKIYLAVGEGFASRCQTFVDSMQAYAVRDTLVLPEVRLGDPPAPVRLYMIPPSDSVLDPISQQEFMNDKPAVR